MQELIDKSHGWFRGWFRKVWEMRGGGLYACGFALGLAFALFPKYIKPRLTRWLFPGGENMEVAKEQ